MLYVVRYGLIVLYTVFWGILGTVLGLCGRGEGVVWVGRNWVGWILASCGVKVEVTGLDNVDTTRPAVFMSNHQSVFDIAAIVISIPVSWRFVAKRELVQIPFFGWALAAGGNIIVDRRNRAAAIQSLERAATRIRRGTNVIVFPEGTRNPTRGLGDFKSGGFHLAIAAQVPVVPVTVSGSRRITPKGSLRIESGPVRIHYGKPIPTDRLSVDDRGWLKEQVREAILAGFVPELEDDSR